MFWNWGQALFELEALLLVNPLSQRLDFSPGELVGYLANHFLFFQQLKIYFAVLFV